MMAATSGLFTCLDMREEPDADVVNGLREHPGGVWSGHMSGAIEQAARRRKDLCGCDRTNKQTDREKKKRQKQNKKSFDHGLGYYMETQRQLVLLACAIAARNK